MDIDFVIAVIREDDIDKFSSVNEDIIKDKRAYSYTKDFITAYGKFPEEKTLYEDLGLKPFDILEPSKYYEAKIVRRAKVASVKKAFQEAQKIIKDDKPIEDAVDAIKDAIAGLDELESDEGFLEIGKDAPARWKEYEERAKFGGLIGVSSPWAELDELTLGWCDGNFIVVVGPTEIGKSWWLTKQFEHSYKSGDRPLMISIELVARTIASRHDAIYANIDYELMRRGTLTGFEADAYEKAADEMFKRDEKGWVVDASKVRKPADIEFLAKRIKPNIILLDGLYLLQGMGKAAMWEKIADVVRELQVIAARLRIPIIATSQFRKDIKKGAKKAGEKGDVSDIGYSHSIPQAADVVIALKQDDFDVLHHEMLFEIIKGREIAKKVRGIKVKWDIPRDFSFVSYDGEMLDDDPVTLEEDEDEEDDYGGLFTGGGSAVVEDAEEDGD